VISNYAQLEAFGRERLSPNFFMREFLHSEIAAWYGLRNVPDHPDTALDVGRRLCQDLLEPLQATFGKVHVRSGYRSPTVNRTGNENGLNCASNEKNHAGHIWDYPDAEGMHGATACVVIPALVDYIALGGSWTAMAWWIHDHLPYSSLCFFSKMGAFNISWHEKPLRQIESYAKPKGYLTKPGMSNHEGSHAVEYKGLLASLRPVAARSHALPVAEDTAVRATTASGGKEHSGQTIDVDTYSRTERASSAPVNYRAVHTKTAWRVARGHQSIENAIYGKDGAAGLFARKVRIDYERHGNPLYVVIWQADCNTGVVVTSCGKSSTGIALAELPIAAIEGFEAQGGVSLEVLARFFQG
jgi:carbon monoxide dehydrogenase subunit G